MKNNDIKLQTTEKPNRYPGTRPFEEKDRSLFFGRNEDISRLSKQIRLEQLLVLFGKSGLGKSSLLNAGILPAMKESGNVLPISIRLGFSTAENENAATVFLNKLAPQLSFNNALWNKLATDYRETWKNDSTDECFWLAAKSLQLQHKGKTILLVLDQFEELFSYSEQAVKRFGFLLSTLLFGEMPQSFQNLLIDKLNHNENLFEPDEIDALYEKTNVKIVISIRSDRMSLLNRLKTHIPQILQKTFELQSLSIAQAKEAMLKPASAEGDFASPKFEYENAAENLIINYLSENAQERIETFQLQLICQFCENLIIKNYPNPTSLQKAGRVEVKTTDIGDLATIFSRHYDNLINDITDSTQRLAVQKLIEENLIIDNNRVPLPDRVIISKHHISSQLLQQLVNSRLLRSEPNNVGGFSYEISHDTLIEPITKSFKIRFEKEEKERKQHQEQERLNKLLIERKRQRTIIYIVSVAAVVSIIFGIFGFVMWQRAEKSQIETNNALQKADSSLAVAKKLVDAFYFYDNKFALAFKDNRFYFIDKQGNDVEKLGKWEKAVQFDDRGFAKVRQGENDYLLDTLGNFYRVAYRTEDLMSEITAIDLQGQYLTTIPKKIFDNIQLKILLLNSHQISNLPKEIGKLTNLTSLDLNFNDLTVLPPEIEKLTNLTALNLNGNELTILPSEIGNLTNLTSLDLSLNKLTTLPNEIVNLTNLTNLNLRSNQLTDLPFEIGNLTNLTSLDLINNQLTDLPSEIGNLTNLTSLDLSSNELTILPSEIGNLTNLISLDLSGNELTILPPEIGNLTNLTSLDLSNNDLTILPPEIGKLTNLTSLKLVYNDITTLPPEIGNLTNLTEIDLIANKLTTLSSEIGKLQNLTSLNLYGDFTNLPSEIWNLQNLTSLYLYGDFTNLPHEIAKLQNLTSLVLYGDFTNLPPEIGNLQNLTSLFLYGDFTNLPPEIGKLQNLTSLDLIGGFTNLPPEIGNLKNLTSLDLRGNFTNLPHEIGNLKNLTMLNLKGDFTNLPPEIGNLKNLTMLNLKGDFTNLPPEIGNLKNLTSLNLSGNFTNLPPEIGNLQNLTSLNLSGNFTNLPPEIGNLQNLTSLNLSDNFTNLPPEIQKLKELKKLKELEKLYLWHNNFSPAEKQKIQEWLPNCEIYW